MKRWVLMVTLLGLWVCAVLLIGFVINQYRIDEGATVLVIDRSRGWGLHQMDLIVAAVAVLPVLLTCLIVIVVQLIAERRPEKD